ncbi:MAG TPA: dihydrolipoyl dehydrogenase [Tepidisphaeraceae bacterium]|jgi:dihydrolipoamide dehydrogenase
MNLAENTQYDLVIIGAGPGGYVAAIRAAQLGMKVACVEKQYLGGTCLNVGCIPSKALLDSSQRYYELKGDIAKHGIAVGNLSLDLHKMIARKDDVVKSLTSGVGMLFRKNKVDHFPGTGAIKSASQVEVSAADGSKQTLSAKYILIATGSVPAGLPTISFDGKNILSSTEALALIEVPKKLLVVGAGYIGLEMSSVWSRLGAEVQVLEFLDRALPGMDKEFAGLLQRSLEKQGIKFHFGVIAESAKVENGKIKVAWKSKDGSQTGSEDADKVLVSIGRKPLTESLGLEKLNVMMDKRGFIQVNTKTFETSVRGIFAIGDVIGGLMLAHKAEEEGIAAVERMAGQAGHVNYKHCPAVVYTHPELATVGLDEETAKAQNLTIKIGKFPFAANGRAKAMGETEGSVKIIADAKTDEILGCQILGPHASDMIAEVTVAMEMGASSEDIARSFHAHPTLEEAIKEAAMAVDKHAIHI